MLTRASRSVEAVPAWVVAVGFAVLAFALRLLSASRFPVEWDSAQFALGVEHFDTTVDQPHPPGYIFYILLGRVLAASPLDAHTAVVVIAALGSAATVAVGWLAGRALGGTWLGWALGAFLLTEPLLWFYGSVAGTYAFDALAVVLLVLLAARSQRGSWHGVAAVAALALLAGFRQSVIFFLWPLVLVAVLRAGFTRALLFRTAAAAALGLAAWIVPLAVLQPGGLGAARTANAEIWENAARSTSPFFGASADMVRINRWQAGGWTAALVAPLVPVAFVGLAALAARRRREAPVAGEDEASPRARRAGPADSARGVVVALVACVVLQLASVLLIHFGKAGYVLGFLPAVAVLALFPASQTRGAWRVAASALVAGASLFGAERFVRGEGVVPLALTERLPPFQHGQYGAPFRATRDTINDVDARTEEVLAFVDAFAGEPDDTVFVFPSGPGAEAYRQLAYLRPRLPLHYLIGGRDWASTRGYVQQPERDTVVEEGTAKVFVVIAWHDVASMDALERSGLAFRLGGPSSPPGLRTWEVQPGAVVEGVTLGEPTPDR